MNLGTGFKIAGYIGVACAFFGAIQYVNNNRSIRPALSSTGEFEAGPRPTLSYKVSPKAFRILNLDGPFLVKVRKGSYMPLHLKFHPEAGHLVQMQEENGHLNVRWAGSPKRNKLIEIEVTAPNLAEIHLMGKAQLEMEKCEFPILRVFGEGYTRASIGEVEQILVAELTGYSSLKTSCKNAFNIDLKVLDSAKVDISGSAQRLTGWLEGNGKIFSSKGEPVAVRRASVKSYGDSHVTLSKIERMDSWIGGRSVQEIANLPKTILTRTSEDGLLIVSGQPRVWPHDSKLRNLNAHVAGVVLSKAQAMFVPVSGMVASPVPQPGA